MYDYEARTARCENTGLAEVLGNTQSFLESFLSAIVDFPLHMVALDDQSGQPI